MWVADKSPPRPHREGSSRDSGSVVLKVVKIANVQLFTPGPTLSPAWRAGRHAHTGTGEKIVISSSLTSGVEIYTSVSSAVSAIIRWK